MLSTALPQIVHALVGSPPSAVQESKPSIILKPSLQPGSSRTEISSPGLTGVEFESYFQGFVQRFLPGFLGFIAITSVFALIVGGITFMTAAGNEEKLGTAKKIIQWAVIGLVLAMLAFIIVNTILRLPFPKTRGGNQASQAQTAVLALDSKDILPPQEEFIGRPEGPAIGAGKIKLPGGKGEQGTFREQIVPSIITIVLSVTGSIAFIIFTVAGIMLIVGHGNEEMYTKAKNIFIYAVVGLGIVALSYAIIYGIFTLRLEAV